MQDFKSVTGTIETFILKKIGTSYLNKIPKYRKIFFGSYKTEKLYQGKKQCTEVVLQCTL